MRIDQLTPDQTVLKELGIRLSRIRKQQGFSQSRLAAEAGLGVATLRRIEDGKDGQMGTWLKVLRALQLTSSIEALLPESFNSPMAEVKAKNKQRRPKKQPPANDTWGDESP